MITKRQALDEMKHIKNGQGESLIPQSELERYYQLKKVVAHYDAISSLSNDIGWREEKTVEWYTPQRYIEMAREVMGTIDLDPASNAIAQEWIKARVFYSQEEDGLSQEWFGNVWINPPYGRKYPRLFLEKAIEDYKKGRIEQAILLLNHTGASWYLRLKMECVAICQVYKRISFISPEGVEEKSPRYYNDFLYLGKREVTFKRVFGEIGSEGRTKESQ